MTKTTAIIIILLIIIAFGFYFTLYVNPNLNNQSNTYSTSTYTSIINTQTPATNTTSTSPIQNIKTNTNPTQNSTANPVNVKVDISNFSFNPAVLTIKAGTKVTWVNNDSTSHTVTSDSGNLLNSPTLATGQSFSFVFPTTGTINYHCSIHPSMKGTVIVTK